MWATRYRGDRRGDARSDISLECGRGIMLLRVTEKKGRVMATLRDDQVKQHYLTIDCGVIILRRPKESAPQVVEEDLHYH